MTTRKGRISKTYKESHNSIFISWSGENSKTFAKALKSTLETTIFDGVDLKCFVSDVDIASGADWWNKIKKELKGCKQGILCITKENIQAPWIYFEAGAMVAREVPTIPLLISCSVKSLDDSPLKSNQCVNFYDQQKFQKMVWDINERMHLLDVTRSQLDQLAKAGYERLKSELSTVLKELTTFRLFNVAYTCPPGVSIIKKQTIFVSAPMTSISDSQYNELRTGLSGLYDALKKLGFSANNITCPIIDKPPTARFNGEIRAIRDNFTALKQVDCMIAICPWNCPSSVLVEIGYGIALCKKIVVFYRDKLPYMLEKAGESIEHVKSYRFKEYWEINKILEGNGMALFGDGTDE